MNEKYKARNLLNLALTGVTLVTVSHLTPAETKSAVNALLSEPTGCAETMPQLSVYDTIAVFGAGTYTDEDGLTQPNSYQLGRIKAAAAAYVAGFANNIVLIDAGDDQVQSATVEKIQTFVKDMSGGNKPIPRESIKIISNSVNTAQNVEDLRQFLLNGGLSRALSITDNFHYERLNILLQNYGVDSNVATTECLAAQFIPLDLPELEAREKTSEMEKMKDKEWLALVELSVDFKGKLTIALKNLNNPNKVNAAD